MADLSTGPTTATVEAHLARPRALGSLGVHRSLAGLSHGAWRAYCGPCTQRADLNPAATQDPFGPGAAALTAQIDAFQQEYCIPGNYFLPVSVNAQFIGPAATLLVQGGSCQLTKSHVEEDFGRVELVCSEPSLQVFHLPAAFISKRLTPAVFISESCIFSKVFGTLQSEAREPGPCSVLSLLQCSLLLSSSCRSLCPLLTSACGCSEKADFIVPAPWTSVTAPSPAGPLHL